MTRVSITVELDDETVDCLAVLGEPTDVLARLACSAAAAVCRPDRRRRDETDESLRIERGSADAAIASDSGPIERAADEVVQNARRRADHLVQSARDAADRERPRSPPNDASVARERVEADERLAAERSSADAALDQERSERKSSLKDALSLERGATDDDLRDERTQLDELIVDQREANERMVGATIRAQELTVEADAAKGRAEASERALREVAEFREMFIGILGHDLRTPLAAITVAAGLLVRRGHLDDLDARTAARIIGSSQRMARMITQLLDLTRARLGGGFPIALVQTDLREVCRNVVEEFEVTTLDLQAAGELIGTWDEDRLAEALSNLAGNAIEHAAAGTAVHIKARGEGERVIVEVINEGEPIPADVLPYIFEPFRRAKQGERSATGNLGLGLYIAQQIVRSHGGTLEGRSADGATTFVMSLPRHSKATPARE